jgi:hypothetical protein
MLEAPSNAQIGFINTLLKERKHNFAQSFIDSHLVNKREASWLISELKACEKINPGSGVEISPGFYVAPDETVYEVCKSARGFTYAKRLVPKGKRATFTYAPGAIKGCADWKPLTVEVAGAMGRKFGFCCICGRTLTNPESVEAGIGPVCGGRL